MKPTFVRLSPALTSLALVALAACGKDPPPVDSAPPPPATTMTPAMSATSAPSPMPSATMAEKPMPPEPPPAPALTDEQVLHVLHTANLGEIDQAKLALKKGKDAKVKKLGTMMQKEHGDADKKVMDLAKKAKLTPAENPVSTALESDAKANTAAMDKEMGAAFDKVYVDAQVKEHEVVLDTIDKKLLPSAKNEELKMLLGDIRKSIAMHLTHAKETQAGLAAPK